MPTIILKLASPLQSWGSSSKFEARHSEKYPTKSAIIGLLGAALGIRREDNRIHELNLLDFAVRIDQSGSLLHDYHTAKKYKNNGDIDRTYVTHRYYLQDAIFMVAIHSEENQLITDLYKALQTPYFQLYLGRRSNAINADYLFSITEKNPIESLKSIPWQAADWYKKRVNHTHLTIIADSTIIESQQQRYISDYVESFSQAHRQFGFRSASKLYIDIPERIHLSEHDVFNSI